MRLSVLLIAVLTLTSSLHAHPLADWVRTGQVADIERAVADGRWANTAAGDLARAILSDAARAVPIYRRVAADPAVEPALLALAWHRLHGYARMTEDRALEADAHHWLTAHPNEAATWFPAGLPDPVAHAAWTVQIGAFSDPANARRLADQQRSRGYTVTLEALERGATRLHAVRVGRFPDEHEAHAFAERVYGAAGLPFRVVEISL